MAISEKYAQIESMLGRMTPQQRQQFAAMHKNSPDASIVIPMALAITQQEQQMRQAMQAQQAGQQGEPPKVVDQAIANMAPQQQQLPEDQGIATLPAENMQNMAYGGIAGYADGGFPQDIYSGDPEYGGPGMAGGGMVERYQSGGKLGQLSQYEEMIRAEAERQGMDPGLAVRLFMAESAGNPNAISSKGAVGLGQLMPDAAKEMGLDPKKDRTDPAKNITASVGYFMKQQQKYGSPVLAAAAYNWGPGNLDKHLKKNKGQLVTENLPAETQDYLQKLAPPAAAAKPTREELIAQIPGQTAAGRATTPEPERRPQDYLFGAGETGLATLTGMASPITGLLRKGYQAATTGTSEPMEKQMAATTFTPRGEAGQAMTQELGRFLTQDMKLPPYIPALGGVAPRSSVSRTAAAADDAAALAAREATPRLPSPNTPATPGGRAQGIAALQQQKSTAEAAARASAAAQQEAAAARVAAQRLGAINAELPGAATRAGAAGMAGMGAAVATDTAPAAIGSAAQAVPREDDDSYNRMEAAKFIRQAEAAREASERLRAATEAKKEAPPEVKKQAKEEGWTKDDWITFGLTLASTPGGFGVAAGKAGLATMAARREREKGKSEKEYREALMEQARRPAAEIQLLEKMKDPEFAALYQQFAAAKREPMTREKAMQIYASSPYLGMKYPNMEDFVKMAMAGMQSASGIAIPEGVTVNRIG